MAASLVPVLAPAAAAAAAAAAATATATAVVFPPVLRGIPSRGPLGVNVHHRHRWVGRAPTRNVDHLGVTAGSAVLFALLDTVKEGSAC